MKKLFIIIVAILCGISANAQLNITKCQKPAEQVKTISAYWIGIYQDTDNYYLVARSGNQYDENDYWLKIGSTKQECIDSINALLDITSDDATYTIEDAFGGSLRAYKVSSIGEKILCLEDRGHRYAGSALISSIYLKKARRWFEES